MNAPATRWRDRLFHGQAAVQVLWVLAPLLTWAVDFTRNRYNTYRIYRQVFWHQLEGLNLYLPYPGQYGDVNLYGPVFSLIIAPFALLPDVAGGLLWNASMAALLFVAIRRLRLPPERRLLLLLLAGVELANAVWSNQFNPAVAALMLLTFADVEEGRDFRAPLWILAGAFVKIYSAVGLVFLLFSRNRRVFLAGCVTWSLVLLAAPMALSSPGHVLQSYADWFHALVHKDALNVGLQTAQDISLMGLVRRLVGQPLPGGWFYLFGIPLVLAPFARLDQFRHRAFRLLALASLLMFVVLFSSGSENSSYVICATGAGLWLASQEEPFRPRNALLIGALLLAALAPTDLLSVAVRRLSNSYALKALPHAAVWLLLVRDLVTRDFGLASRTPAAQGAALERGGRPAAEPMENAA